MIFSLEVELMKLNYELGMKGWGFPGGSVEKNLPANVGDVRDMVRSLGRSPEEGHGNPLQYSCLKNSMTEEPGEQQSIGSQRVGHD